MRRRISPCSPGSFLRLPSVRALLAGTHRDGDVLRLVALRRKNLDNQRGQEQEHPLHRHPPPANEKPPEDVVVLRFQLRLVNDLYGHVGAFALRANHGDSFFLQSVGATADIIHCNMLLRHSNSGI